MVGFDYEEKDCVYFQPQKHAAAHSGRGVCKHTNTLSMIKLDKQQKEL